MYSNSLGVLLKEAKEKLKYAEIPEYALDAELIMMQVTGMNRIEVLTEKAFVLDESQKNEFFEKIQRRIKREPVSYILGYREFMGLNFFVEQGILIPRPDTEVLVETVLQTIKVCGKKVYIAEVGTGSGCISVSIAKFSDAECYGVDINPKAVELSVKNSVLNKVEENTHFYYGDLFKGLPSNMMFDIIVSNPPYIREKDMDSLMIDVRNYEPENALCGGEDGLEFYRRISSEGKKFLKKNGYIFFEIGYDEADEVLDILINMGYTDICVIKDLNGLDRVVTARLED